MSSRRQDAGTAKEPESVPIRKGKSKSVAMGRIIKIEGVMPDIDSEFLLGLGGNAIHF